jgi:hypothetical protein
MMKLGNTTVVRDVGTQIHAGKLVLLIYQCTSNFEDTIYSQRSAFCTVTQVGLGYSLFGVVLTKKLTYPGRVLRCMCVLVTLAHHAQ